MGKKKKKILKRMEAGGRLGKGETHKRRGRNKGMGGRVVGVGGGGASELQSH